MGSLPNIWGPGSLVVVHLEFSADGLQVRAVKMKLKENFTPAATERFEDLPAVIKKFGKSAPYALHVDGTGVLTRLVEFVPGYREQLIVNGDKDDFYFCAFEDSFQVAVSFFRKNLVAEQLERLRQNKVMVFGITCGIIPVLAACQETENIHFDYTLQIEKGRIRQLKRVEHPHEKSLVNHVFRTRTEAIQAGIAIAQLQSPETFSDGLDSELKRQAFEAYTQFSKFRFFGILTVTVILAALIGNYFYLNHLNQETAQLETDLMLNNENLSLLGRLEQEKTRKEQLISTSGTNAPAFISFYIDEIGACVPDRISLSEMLVFPLKQKLKDKQKTEINQQEIEISGFTPSSEILDDWMEKMNRFSWVGSVELINYLKSEHARAEFKLVITLEP